LTVPGSAFPDPPSEWSGYELTPAPPIGLALSQRQEAIEALKREIDNEIAQQAGKMNSVPPGHKVIVTGPALHLTQVRAAAIQAAANLPLANLRPSSGDLDIWRETVMSTADVFAHYIETGHHAVLKTAE
jgi:hypothetical protein